MKKDLPAKQNTLFIDSLELLIRFILKCKNDVKRNKADVNLVSSCADIVSAVYQYRRYPNINKFIEKYLTGKEDYFKLQWARATWAKLSTLTEAEISELVINQIQLVDNSLQEQ